jgi:hypothetical protein
MLTGFGMRSWFWACRPSMLVAVPGGFWVAIQAASITAGIGGVAGSLTTAPGQKTGGRLVEQLVSASDQELLAMSGAVVYRIEDVEAIECKQPKLATNPDFIIVRNDGTRQKYGLANAIAVEGVVAALRDCYGDLIQQP